jgi:hypothetical protein
VVIVHRVEARVAVPGLVEVDPIAGFLEQRLRALLSEPRPVLRAQGFDATMLAELVNAV